MLITGIALVALIIHTFIQYISEFTAYRLEDFTNPKKWRNVYIALLKAHIRNIDNVSSEIYLKDYEMLNYAMRVARCYPCLEAGRCVDCNCPTEEKFNVGGEECSLGKWGNFKTEQELRDWLMRFKPEFSLTIKPRNNEQQGE